MKRTIIFFTIIIPCIFFLSQCNPKDEAGGEASETAANPQYGGYESQVKWGEHLVMVGACGDCHTPKKMTAAGPVDDSSLLLSGHPAQMPPPDVNRLEMQQKGNAVTQTLTAWVGPWGISYTANLTPDTTGIGMWKEDQFIYALRNGVSKGLPGSRALLPPMPWFAFKFFTDDELKAIFAYLMSIKPVNNVVPAPVPPATN